MNQHPDKRNIINPWFGAAIILAILIAVNVIANSLRIRVDMTEEKLFTLSPGTSEFIHQLEVPVTLKLYVSRGNHVPGMIKQFAQRIEDLLRVMENAGAGKIILETYDPEPDSDEEEWAQRYGLIGQPVSPLGGDMIYLGLAAVSGQREAAIPFLAPDAEMQMEYNIARLLHEVTRKSKPKLGVLSSLPVLGSPMASPMMGRPSADTGWVAMRELKRHFDVLPVRSDSESIDEEITALMVIHPKELTENTLYAIDQFVMKGGRLIVFQDPLCLADRESGGEMAGMGMMMEFSSDLNRLTSAWGAEMKPREVVADPSSASPVSFGTGRSERMPSWLTLRSENINRYDLLTSDMNVLMFPFAGGFTIRHVEGITTTPLVVTSPDTSLINSFQATAPGPEKMRSASAAGALPLAIRLFGRFNSAFTNGAPATAENSPPVTNQATHIARSEKDSLVMLVGDVDFINDQHAFRIMNLMGQTLAEYANDNFNLMLGMVEQSTGSEALIGLGRRGVQDRTFTRVRALEEEAQKRWQAEELKLIEKLQETQRRLGELQMVKNEDQQMIITPEQKAEIENFRRIRFETQRELKEVRRNLRKDIEQLGINIKVINLAAVPAFVALFGLAREWHRRRQ